MKDFEELVARYQQMVCGVAYAVLRDRARSEEVAQEAFLVAWVRLPTMAMPPPMPAWLCQVARNLARNAARRRRETPMSTEPSEPRADARQQMIERETVQVAERALAGLRDRDREAVVLFYRGEQSMKEVAAALGITEEAARQRVHRGRSRLRDAIGAVEAGLRLGRPGPAFTAACVAGALAAAGRADAAVAGAHLGGRGVMIAAAGGLAALATVVIVVSGAGRHQATPAREEVAAASPTSARAPAPASRPTRPVRTPPPATAFAASADDPTRVDLDLLSAPAADVLRMLAHQLDAPLALHGDLSIAVNLRAHGTPALDALDEVLAQAGATRQAVPALLVVDGGATDTRDLGDAPVSVDFERAPLDDVLATLGAVLGTPIAAAHDVDPSTPVTVQFDATPARDALAAVLAQVHLGLRPTTGYAVDADD